jgi:SAM-dependent methyltransferase
MLGPIFKRRNAILLDAPAPGASGPEGELHASHSLPRLAQRLRSTPSARVLDLGNVVGSNLQFFIDLGCKVTADDVLRPVETLIPDNGNGMPEWKGPGSRRLDHPDSSFDAVLVWDLFDFVAAPEARNLSRELHRIAKPHGIVMAYFTSRETERHDPARRFRIVGYDRIEWVRIGNSRPLRHVYQNRDIERMFEGFRTHTATFLQNGTREILLEKKAPITALRKS